MRLLDVPQLFPRLRYIAAFCALASYARANYVSISGDVICRRYNSQSGVQESEDGGRYAIVANDRGYQIKLLDPLGPKKVIVASDYKTIYEAFSVVNRADQKAPANGPPIAVGLVHDGPMPYILKAFGVTQILNLGFLLTWNNQLVADGNHLRPTAIPEYVQRVAQGVSLTVSDEISYNHPRGPGVHVTFRGSRSSNGAQSNPESFVVAELHVSPGEAKMPGAIAFEVFAPQIADTTKSASNKIFSYAFTAQVAREAGELPTMTTAYDPDSPAMITDYRFDIQPPLHYSLSPGSPPPFKGASTFDLVMQRSELMAATAHDRSRKAKVIATVCIASIIPFLVLGFLLKRREKTAA